MEPGVFQCLQSIASTRPPWNPMTSICHLRSLPLTLTLASVRNPASSRHLPANSSNSRGLSDVTMPTAETQPLQSGWQAFHLKCIGCLRSSRVPPACAELPSVVIAPGNARQTAVAPRSAQPRNFSDLTNLNLVPSPKPLQGAMATAPLQRHMILSSKRR